jgi:hypothetical protein
MIPVHETGRTAGASFPTTDDASDVRKALSEAKSQGKHDVLVRVKNGRCNEVVALPIG